MSYRNWPDVDVDEYGQMTCPIPRCDAPLHLIRTYCIPLIAEQEPDHEPENAISDAWSVECTNGHTLRTHVDQAREQGEDETADSALEYDHFATHKAINTLGGERL